MRDVFNMANLLIVLLELDLIDDEEHTTMLSHLISLHTQLLIDKCNKIIEDRYQLKLKE